MKHTQARRRLCWFIHCTIIDRRAKIRSTRSGHHHNSFSSLKALLHTRFLQHLSTFQYGAPSSSKHMEHGARSGSSSYNMLNVLAYKTHTCGYVSVRSININMDCGWPCATGRTPDECPARTSGDFKFKIMQCMQASPWACAYGALPGVNGRALTQQQQQQQLLQHQQQEPGHAMTTHTCTRHLTHYYWRVYVFGSV